MRHILKSPCVAADKANAVVVGSKLTGRRSASGFTMVELMVVVAIIGILAAVAIPSYKSSVKKSNRSAAKTALLDMAAREEKYYSLNNAYSGSATSNQDLFGTTSVTFPINAPLTGPTLYTIATPTITAATATAPATFSITATPTGTQTGDQCGNFTVNSAGQQSVSGSGTCW
jgi:type IV pilus assembly protein PilE